MQEQAKKLKEQGFTRITPTDQIIDKGHLGPLIDEFTIRYYDSGLTFLKTKNKEEVAFRDVLADLHNWIATKGVLEVDFDEDG